MEVTNHNFHKIETFSDTENNLSEILIAVVSVVRVSVVSDRDLSCLCYTRN